MIRFFNLVLSSSLLLACSTSPAKPKHILPSDKDSRYIDLSAALENKVIGNLRQRWPQLGTMGSGGAMMDNIEAVNYTFTYPSHALNIEEARVMIIDCLQEFLRVYNEDEKIRPYLADYPFTLSNFDLSILFQDREGLSVVDGKSVARVANSRERLFYSTCMGEEFPFQNLWKETYTEALVLTQQTKQNRLGAK